MKGSIRSAGLLLLVPFIGVSAAHSRNLDNAALMDPYEASSGSDCARS